MSENVRKLHLRIVQFVQPPCLWFYVEIAVRAAQQCSASNKVLKCKHWFIAPCSCGV